MITTLLRYDHQIEVIPSQDLHFRSPDQSTGSCHQNQQCQMWAETSSIKTKLPCSETFHLRFYLDYQQQKVFLTSSQPRMSGAQFQCLELSLVQNRPVRILTLKQGNKFLGIGVIITSDVIPSSGISRHSRITPPPSQRTSRQVWPCCSGTICWYGRKYYEECRNNCHNRLPSWHLLDIGHHITFSTPWRWQTVRKF